MNTPDAGQSRPRRRAKKTKDSSELSASRSPTQRLDLMTEDRIEALEADKSKLEVDRERLEATVSRLQDRLMIEVP